MRRETIHLINDLRQLGGSEFRTVELYRALAPVADVAVWTEYAPDPEVARAVPVARIDVRRLRFPKRGSFVFVGVYYHIGRWIRFAWPSRIIQIYNTPHPELLRERIQRLSLGGRRVVELVFASRSLRDECGLRGVVEDSIIDIERFSPERGAPRMRASSKPSFVVGRASRDVPYKHAENDPQLYGRLADLGCQIRVAGGTCLRGMIAEHPRVQLLPRVPQAELPAFLRSLDCFLYRTSSHWHEAFGRVIVEAMACSLPVVCERDSGAADYIEHGKTGFLVDSDQEALETVLLLKDDASLRARIASAARKAVEERYSAGAIAAIRRFYLQRGPFEGLDLSTARGDRPTPPAARGEQE
jgi:glycosyltransferase involved in cell wall biosynthesis